MRDDAVLCRALPLGRGLGRVTNAMTFRVKGQGRKVTWSVWQVLAHKSITKFPRNTKICRKVANSMCNAYQVRGLKVKGQVTRPISRVVFVGGGEAGDFPRHWFLSSTLLFWNVPSQPGKLNSPLLVYSRMTDSWYYGLPSIIMS